MARAPFLLAMLLCACDETHPVPFHQETDPAHANTEPVPAPDPTTQPSDGEVMAAGTHRIVVEGAPIEIAGSIRAVLPRDLDGDGDRDALVVAENPGEPASLLVFLHDGAQFAAARTLASSGAATCSFESASLRTLPPERVVAQANLLCAGAARRLWWVVSLEATPRLLETLGVLEPGERAPGALDLAIASADRDGDEHPDVIVTVTLRDGDRTATIDLPWLDRPSGLARQAAEPEATFLARAREAARSLRRQPQQALTTARAVLALHTVLCRESEAARLRVGDSEGIGCGASAGAAQAASIAVQAEARLGQLADALEALVELEQPGLAMTDDLRTQARQAIAQAPASAGVTMREGPPRTAPRWGTAPRRSALQFLSEDAVLMLGDGPQVWDLASGSIGEYAGPQTELRIIDPAQRFAIASIGRRCEGHVVRIAPIAAVMDGALVGGIYSTALIEAREAPPGARCPDLDAALRNDDGGWRALGWAPSGIVLAHGGALRVVPLDVDGHSAGPPTEIADGTAAPAPLAGGAISEDGRTFVELRAGGVLLHRSGQGTLLLWPAGWGEMQGQPSDPAVSPSGRRVALLRGGRVILLERATQ